MTALPDDPVELMSLLCASMQGLQIDGAEFHGTLSPDLDFEQVRARLENLGWLDQALPDTRRLSGNFPSNFFESMGRFLTAPARRINAPARFYIHDLDLQVNSADQSNLPPLLLQYFQATRLFSLLRSVADHVGGIADDKSCIFLYPGEKVEVTAEYQIDDLMELKELDSFEDDFFRSEAHQQQKKTIIKSALIELYTGQHKTSLAQVIKRFEDLVEKVRAGYQLYVAEFSFQKVKAEVEREKLDAMLKLNKVFSDIQNQLLAIPAALVLVGGQMQSGGWSLKNMMVWAGALVFAVLMDLLIRNQGNTLKAVDEEIRQQKTQIASKYQAVASRFQDIYDEIDRRYNHQRWLIRVVDLLVGVSFLATSILLLWFAEALPPAYAALKYLGWI
ncbi:MAG: hypothetical protein H6R19_1974 [Proteobacteria bacterium]|nr:hypothetical protein [Pseudomonadota bacterium]